MVRATRLTLTIAVLTSALVVRMAYAAPVSVAAQLRAVACCTEHRGALPSNDDAGRCCGVSSVAQDPTRTSPAATPPAPAPVVSFALPAGMPALPAKPTAHVEAPSWSGDPPLFLAHLTLRN